MNRRTLLAGAAAIGALGAARRPELEIGVQLWTLDAQLRTGLEAGLAGVAALGIRTVETAGLHGRSPQAFAAALASAGLGARSCHTAMGPLQTDAAREIATAAALGATWLVAASPQPSRPVRPGAGWADGLAEAMTLDDWRRTAETLNRVGVEAQASGLSLAYHNHAFELDRYDGVVALDLLTAETDPALVSLELDVGWAFAAGADPAALIDRLGARVGLLHLKDMARTLDGAWRSTPIGAGGVDWPGVLAAARRAGAAAAFVEQEPPFERPPLQDLAASLAHLSGLTGRPRPGAL